MAEKGFERGRGDPAEYATLRDEMLRADDQAVQIAGFATMSASFLASAVVASSSTGTKMLLLIGFNLIVLTLIVKVREKRGQQGRMAAYLRVFHEVDTGWESRIGMLRTADQLRRATPWRGADPRELGERSAERFSRRAAMGELFVFSFLSLLAVLASAQQLNAPTIDRGWVIVLLAVQVGVFALVVWQAGSFRLLQSSSMMWEVVWRTMKWLEEIRQALEREQALVLVNGPPASGKTSLAETLSAMLRVDVLSKDRIKESVYEDWKESGRISVDPTRRDADGPRRELTVGSAVRAVDRAFLDELDDVSTGALFDAALRRLPCIVDTNVKDHQREQLNRFDRIIEVHVTADEAVLRERYDRRARHEVHVAKSDATTATFGGLEPLGVSHDRVVRVRSDEPDQDLGVVLEGLSTILDVDVPAERADATTAAVRLVAAAFE